MLWRDSGRFEDKAILKKFFIFIYRVRAIDTAPGHVSVGDVVKLASGHFVKVIALHPETVRCGAVRCGHVIVPASVVPAQDSEAFSRSLGTSPLSRQPAEKSAEFHPLVRAADTTVKNS